MRSEGGDVAQEVRVVGRSDGVRREPNSGLRAAAATAPATRAGHRSTRSMTNSCSASGISSGAGACFGFNSLALQSSRHSLTAGCPGASDKGTEILTGVLEAAVRTFTPARHPGNGT